MQNCNLLLKLVSILCLGNGTLNKHAGVDYKQLSLLAKINENQSGEVIHEFDFILAVLNILLFLSKQYDFLCCFILLLQLWQGRWQGNEIVIKVLKVRDWTTRKSRDFNEECPKLRLLFNSGLYTVCLYVFCYCGHSFVCLHCV